jgi:hypothetical protein
MVTSKASKIQSHPLQSSGKTKKNSYTEPPFPEEQVVMTNNRFFGFYLDAWNYCVKHNIDIKKIFRYDWKTWEVRA